MYITMYTQSSIRWYSKLMSVFWFQYSMGELLHNSGFYMVLYISMYETNVSLPSLQSSTLLILVSRKNRESIRFSLQVFWQICQHHFFDVGAKKIRRLDWTEIQISPKNDIPRLLYSLGNKCILKQLTHACPHYIRYLFNIHYFLIFSWWCRISTIVSI